MGESPLPGEFADLGAGLLSLVGGVGCEAVGGLLCLHRCAALAGSEWRWSSRQPLLLYPRARVLQ